MAIKSPTTRTHQISVPQEQSLAEVEATHLVIDFTQDAGYLRQVYRDQDGGVVDVRFLRITGDKYSNFVGSSIVNKVTALNNLDESAIGVNIEEMSGREFFEAIRRR